MKSRQGLSFVLAAPWQSLKRIIYVQKFNYLVAVVTLKRLLPKVCFGHLFIAFRTAWVHRPWNTTCGIS